MQRLEKLLTQPKNRKVGITLALLSTVVPWPIAGVHKFYLGQTVWGVMYFLLWNTPIPSIACAIDAMWYFVQGEEQFNNQFNNLPVLEPAKVKPKPLGIASDKQQIRKVEPLQIDMVSGGLRELDKLREEGLITDYEFEQKRRQLLDRIN